MGYPLRQIRQTSSERSQSCPLKTSNRRRSNAILRRQVRRLFLSPLAVSHTGFFRDMFCAGRVADEDLKRTMRACGGSIQTSVNSMTPDVLGSCDLFEEKQIGGERSVIDKQSLLVWCYCVVCLLIVAGGFVCSHACGGCYRLAY